MRAYYLLLLFAFAIPAQAEWSSVITSDYILGDADSRISAKAILLEQIQRKASLEAGQYVQSTRKLQNGELSETVQVLGAAMVETKNVTERYTITETGQTKLTISAQVSLDDDELAKRIENVQRDETLLAKLNKIEEENKRLRQSVDLLSAKLATPNLADKDARDIVLQRTDAIQNIEENRKNQKKAVGTPYYVPLKDFSERAKEYYTRKCDGTCRLLRLGGYIQEPRF